MPRVAVVLLLIACATDVHAQAPAARWYKGNTHTHTLNSDGDSTPDEVVRWYREHGYHFLVLTDHNFLTDVTALNALHGADDQFLVLKGEEVTDRFGDIPFRLLLRGRTDCKEDERGDADGSFHTFGLLSRLAQRYQHAMER